MGINSGFKELMPRLSGAVLLIPPTWLTARTGTTLLFCITFALPTQNNFPGPTLWKRSIFSGDTFGSHGAVNIAALWEVI